MPDPDLVRLALPPDVASVAEARRAVRRAAAAHLDGEVLDDAVTVTSELVTNAVLHAGSAVELVVRLEGRAVRIEVADDSRRQPRRKHYSAESATGRGLFLVESLATLAGVDQNEDGKVVWAVFGDAAVEPPVALRAAAGAETSGATTTTDFPSPQPEDEELQVAAADEAPGLRGSLLVGAAR